LGSKNKKLSDEEKRDWAKLGADFATVCLDQVDAIAKSGGGAKKNLIDQKRRRKRTEGLKNGWK
jgi:hypothetical protein